MSCNTFLVLIAKVKSDRGWRFGNSGIPYSQKFLQKLVCFSVYTPKDRGQTSKELWSRLKERFQGLTVKVDPQESNEFISSRSATPGLAKILCVRSVVKPHIILRRDSGVLKLVVSLSVLLFALNS